MLKKLHEEQEVRRKNIILDKKGGRAPFTGVGFEFDIGLFGPGFLRNKIHTELGVGTNLKYGPPYTLETDDGNVLEMSTPIFFIAENEKGLPQPNEMKQLHGALIDQLKVAFVQDKPIGLEKLRNNLSKEPFDFQFEEKITIHEDNIADREKDSLLNEKETGVEVGKYNVKNRKYWERTWAEVGDMSVKPTPSKWKNPQINVGVNFGKLSDSSAPEILRTNGRSLNNDNERIRSTVKNLVEGVQDDVTKVANTEIALGRSDQEGLPEGMTGVESELVRRLAEYPVGLYPWLVYNQLKGPSRESWPIRAVNRVSLAASFIKDTRGVWMKASLLDLVRVAQITRHRKQKKERKGDDGGSWWLKRLFLKPVVLNQVKRAVRKGLDEVVADVIECGVTDKDSVQASSDSKWVAAVYAGEARHDQGLVEQLYDVRKWVEEEGAPRKRDEEGAALEPRADTYITADKVYPYVKDEAHDRLVVEFRDPVQLRRLGWILEGSASEKRDVGIEMSPDQIILPSVSMKSAGGGKVQDKSNKLVPEPVEKPLEKKQLKLNTVKIDSSVFDHLQVENRGKERVNTEPQKRSVSIGNQRKIIDVNRVANRSGSLLPVVWKKKK
ncbi:uncharacterized protein ChrSV_p0020 (plasmid) [Chromobacterium vaccinii]|nr:uncharacterized protein ChrSW_p0020 [Chromobacterium vaccinii]QND87438.1 uncharacterized protein ChrSV_p0020 [Chromobacterium vaccinii]